MGNYKIEALKDRRAALLEEHEAANRQWSAALDEVTRKRLARQMEALAEEIDDIDRQLAALAAGTGNEAPVPPEGPAGEGAPKPGEGSTPPAEAGEGPHRAIWDYLWVRYLLWLALTALGLIADLGEVFGLSPCAQFGLLAGSALFGGVGLLAYSLWPANRAGTRPWDRRVTGGLTLLVTLFLAGLICRNCHGLRVCAPFRALWAPAAEPLALIEREREAVLAEDMEAIREIFAPDATKTDARTAQSWNAIARYQQTFAEETYLEIAHANVNRTIERDTAVVTHDSCGAFLVQNTGEKVDFHCPQCNIWTFRRDRDGRWWATDFTYNLVSPAPLHTYAFEDGTAGCWQVRYVEGEPLGGVPSFTTEAAYEGEGALRFDIDLARTGRGQVVVYEMPFAGEASAYLFVPPDAPDDLVAGFFAMELAADPWHYHDPTQMAALQPGAWTRVAWEVDVSGWARPLHLLGIEVRRAGGDGYGGYLLIDAVTIVSR